MVCEAGNVEVLLLSFPLVVFEEGILGIGKVGGDRDTSLGLGRCMRGAIIADMCRRGMGMGTQEVLVMGFELVVWVWMVGEESAAMACKATRRIRKFIFE